MVNHVCPMFQLDFEGLTGRIEFDDDGYRNNYKLDVYTVSLDVGPKKVKTQTRQFTFYVYLDKCSFWYPNSYTFEYRENINKQSNNKLK